MKQHKRARRPIGRKGKIALAVFVWGISAYILVCISGVIAAAYSARDAKEVWRGWQTRYIQYLADSYESDPDFCKVDESDFLANCTYDELMASKLNEVRYIATHNSYKTGLTAETKYLYHGPFAAFMNTQYDYIFDTVTEQFNLGIRSLELDVGKIETDDGFAVE